MLLPLKAITLSKPRKDGNFLIYYQYFYNNTKRVLLSTEIAVPAASWNSKRQCVSKSLPANFGSADNLNDDLLRMRKAIETLIQEGQVAETDNLGLYVKGRFDPKAEPGEMSAAPVFVPKKKKGPNLFAEIKDYIASKEKKVCPKGLSNYHGMKAHLLAFQEHRKKAIEFSSFDYNFYLDFVDFLTYDYPLPRKKKPEYGLKINTVGRTIKQLRVFVRDRVRRKIISHIDMEDFKAPSEESDAIYLSYEEVGKIYAYDFSKAPTLALYRDMFVFSCLTALRFSDFSTLNYSDLRNGMLFKKTEKVDNWVVIPLRAEALEIFERHFKDGIPVVSNPVFNRYIKEVATSVGITEPITFSYKKGNRDMVVTKPKADWITTHTGRRTFCTVEYLAGTDVSLIMRISGHKTLKQFLRYIKVTEEEAAMKMQSIWLARNNMTAFSLAKTA